MRRAKIDVGNAQDVIQRGNNVTIIPAEYTQSLSGGGTFAKGITARYAALDVANGDANPNSDAIEVNDPAFPGWRVVEYDCASGVCASLPGSTTYVEVVNNLILNWSVAYLVLTIEHAGASGSEFLFKVSEASLESSLDDIIPVNLSYSYATGNVLPAAGVYVWLIALTDDDGKRVMAGEMRSQDGYYFVFNEDYLAYAAQSKGEAYTVFIHGAFRPEDRYNPMVSSNDGPRMYYNYIIQLAA